MNPFEGYVIASLYGPRPDPHGRVPGLVFHAGIDLKIAHKAPIKAFVDGVVQFADERRSTGFGGFGKTVAIRDKNSKLHCYCHLDSIAVKVGQQVKKGHVIGTQGMTGTDAQGRPTSTGSHLHYEIRKKSEPNNGWNADESQRCYNPTQYLIEFYASENKVEKPQKEDENMLVLSDWMWGALLADVEEMVADDVLEKQWIPKVKNRELTVSELSWLNLHVMNKMRKAGV